MAIDSEALHGEALRQQAARFEEVIATLTKERDTALQDRARDNDVAFGERRKLQTEIATLAAERDAAVNARLIELGKTAATVSALNRERDEAIAALQREVDACRDAAAAARLERDEAIGRARSQAAPAAVPIDDTPIKPGWRESWRDLLIALKKMYQDGHSVSTLLVKVEEWLDEQARVVDAEFHEVVTVEERDVLLERLERLIEIGDDMASMLSDTPEEVRAWKRVSADYKAAPDVKALAALGKTRAAAFAATRDELRAARAQRDQAVSAHVKLVERLVKSEARLAGAIAWIEALAEAHPTGGPIVQAAAKFVEDADEVPF